MEYAIIVSFSVKTNLGRTRISLCNVDRDTSSIFPMFMHSLVRFKINHEGVGEILCFLRVPNVY